MTKKELLDNVYEAEINGALNKWIGLYQTKSKLAEELVKDDILIKETLMIGPLEVSGYRLTEYGRLIYCTDSI